MLAALTASAAVCAEDQDLVDYRIHIMKSLDEQVASINMILQQKAPADGFASQVRSLAVTAATVKSSFKTRMPSAHAKPDIWADWPDFAKRLDEFVAATQALADTAQSGGLAAAGPKVPAALTCKGCHDKYRQ